MDEVFRALADPVRRRLLDRLRERDGQSLRDLCAGLDMTRQSVSKHLAVLAAAGVVTTERRGREKLHHLNAEPIDAIARRWIGRYARERVRALADLKTTLEGDAMSDVDFHYTTYIRTTPEQLWQALTEPEFTRRYWGVSLESDWREGSPVVWRQDGATMADPAQVVLAARPYHLLSYTWHTFTPDFAAAAGLGAEILDRIAAERRSRVTFEIEPVDEEGAGPLVRLTVRHEGFEPGSTVREMVSEGWPRLLADLKTLLETGESDW